MKSIKLNRRNLLHLSKPVKVPVYSQNDLVPSLVHIGLGHFHRAHQAVYLDDLLSRGLSNDGIFEMNLIPDSFPLAKILEEQDYLYTLITKNPEAVEEVRVVGSILGYLNAAHEKTEAIRRASAETVKLITLTVTEGGYYWDKNTLGPNVEEAAVRWDLENRDKPKTAPGFVAAVLARRYRESKKPLTVMCCDNVVSNGKVLENCVLFFCQEHYKEIIPWIKDNVSFPCSMVDRITPGTTPELVQELEENFGISDGWPVCGEDFRQWVLEDNFKTPVPDYAAAGVQIVKDVEPYEHMKMRLLNGSHMALSYPGYLLGCRYVDEAITHPLIKDYIRNHFMEQVTPTLEPVPGIDVTAYKNTLISRFSNKNISDTVLRLCNQGSGKMPTFMLNPLIEAAQKNLPYSTICFAFASWVRFLSGKDEQGETIDFLDANKEEITAAAAKARHDPKSFLAFVGVQNLDQSRFDILAGEFKKHLDRIYQKGIKTALEELLAKP